MNNLCDPSNLVFLFEDKNPDFSFVINKFFCNEHRDTFPLAHFVGKKEEKRIFELRKNHIIKQEDRHGT